MYLPMEIKLLNNRESFKYNLKKKKFKNMYICFNFMFYPFVWFKPMHERPLHDV